MIKQYVYVVLAGGDTMVPILAICDNESLANKIADEYNAKLGTSASWYHASVTEQRIRTEKVERSET